MRNDYNTNELLQFMIPGLEMGIRTLQDQITAIKSIIAGNVNELPIEVGGNECPECHKKFKTMVGVAVHTRRMHSRKMKLVTKKRA